MPENILNFLPRFKGYVSQRLSIKKLNDSAPLGLVLV